MVNLSRRAQIALNALQPEDREQVCDSLEALAQNPAMATSDHSIHKLSGVNNLFVMKVNPEIRVIFEVNDSNKEITDIVMHDRLRKFSSGDAK